jgi:hypothetical protein
MKFVIFLLIFINYIAELVNSYKNHGALKKSTNKKVSVELKTNNRMNSLFSINLFHSNLNKKSDNKITLKERFQGYPIITAYSKIEMGSGPIYYQVWSKYFTVSKGLDSMKKFNINPSYKDEQSEDFKSKHKTGVKIPREDQFFFILTDRYLNVLSSRYVIYLLN